MLPYAAAIYLLMSCITAIALIRDKHAANRNTRRTPEKTLHTLELLGGWPGSLLTRQLIRHKTRKRPYRLTLYAIITLHTALWILSLWLTHN
ncbi:MAG: DUF1294 domain-containing protein [Phycisphaerales bacterium JB040]